MVTNVFLNIRQAQEQLQQARTLLLRVPVTFLGQQLHRKLTLRHQPIQGA
jgi:hypothetical protein